MAENYDLKAAAAGEVAAPVLAYGPPAPRKFRGKIGLIGCGGITSHHLAAYRAAGWEVAAFLDANRAAAEKRCAEFFPRGRVCASVEELLATAGVEVVDIATHPGVRSPLIEQVVAAGRHVLSQKPFAVDLAEGERLVRLARAAGAKLAVNQNGRWAPYFSYARQAIIAGLIGEVSSATLTLNWDHTWTQGTAFEKIHHLILHDFGIHWFDAACSFFGDARALAVNATVARAPAQTMAPPLVAACTVTFPNGIATLSFDGSSRYAPRESVVVAGTTGTLRGEGAICAVPAIDITTAAGRGRADLSGAWFDDGFRGTMGELLCAIEEGREPENSAAGNLRSLAVCLAAMKSADTGEVVRL